MGMLKGEQIAEANLTDWRKLALRFRAPDHNAPKRLGLLINLGP